MSEETLTTFLEDLEDWLANGAGAHVCAGWDCATCNRSHWLDRVREFLGPEQDVPATSAKEKE